MYKRQEVPHGTNLTFGLARAWRRPGAAPAASAVSGASVRRILAPLTRRATSFHTWYSHLPGDPPKGLQNDGIGGFGMRTRLWRAAKGGSRAPTRPLDRSNLNFDDRETFFGSDLGHFSSVGRDIRNVGRDHPLLACLTQSRRRRRRCVAGKRLRSLMVPKIPNPWHEI